MHGHSSHFSNFSSCNASEKRRGYDDPRQDSAQGRIKHTLLPSSDRGMCTAIGACRAAIACSCDPGGYRVHNLSSRNVNKNGRCQFSNRISAYQRRQPFADIFNGSGSSAFIKIHIRMQDLSQSTRACRRPHAERDKMLVPKKHLPETDELEERNSKQTKTRRLQEK